MYKATTLIMECSYEIDFTNLTENGVTFKKALGKIIGMKELGDWSCIADDDILIEDTREQSDVEN